jgi:hypothetical protein
VWIALFQLLAGQGDRTKLAREERRLRNALRELADEDDSGRRGLLGQPSRELQLEFQRLLNSIDARQPTAEAV